MKSLSDFYLFQVPQYGRRYPDDPYGAEPVPQMANDRVSGKVIRQVENVFYGVMSIIKSFFQFSPV